jgi:hypothetical protein
MVNYAALQMSHVPLLLKICVLLSMIAVDRALVLLQQDNVYVTVGIWVLIALFNLLYLNSQVLALLSQTRLCGSILRWELIWQQKVLQLFLKVVVSLLIFMLRVG